MKYSKEYYQKNKKKLMEYQRRYRNNPKRRERYLTKARENSRKWYAIEGNRLRRYKYNHESWLRQVKKLEDKAGRPRPEKCEICHRKNTIVFDHCHKTGNFRGWICELCNTILGKVNDDIKILQSLIDYLVQSNKK